MTTAPPFAIDRGFCVGHGRCYALAPEAFVADDMGLGHVREELSGPLDRDVETIVNACPEEAIALLDAVKEGTS